MGLCRIICNCEIFEEAASLAKNGDNKRCDFTVGDMLTQNRSSFESFSDLMYQNNVTAGLSQDPDFNFIINSFGKLAKIDHVHLETIKPSDYANAILMMVINAYTLNGFNLAKVFKCKQIMFAGTFFQNNDFAKYKTTMLLNYLSNSEIQAVFYDNIAFINAMGCFFDSTNVKFTSFM